MTHEEVNTLEDTLREVQNKAEEAGRMVCSQPGNTVGGWIWDRCGAISELVSNMIHESYKLRPVEEPENG